MPKSLKKVRKGAFKTEVLKELCRLDEKQLQGLIVEPLLHALGFENVRDNHGSEEKGKDVVATKVAEFGRTRLYGIQIKRKKFTGNVSSEQSLGNLLNQLYQARDEEVVDPTTNTKRSPDACIFITPYPISPSTLDKFHKLSQKLYKENIEIIDGSKLLELAQSHIPDFITNFSMDVQYRYQLEHSLNHIPESINAFSLHTEIELSSIYIDSFLDSPDNYFELFTTRKLRLQGPTLVSIDSVEIDKFNEFGEWFGGKPIINNPPKLTSKDQKNRFNILKGRLPENSKKLICQIDIDPLLIATQKKSRASLISLSQVTSTTNVEEINKAIFNHIETQKKGIVIRDFPSIDENWPFFVSKRSKPSWKKPEIRIPSSILNKIDCNKFITGGPGVGKTTLLRKLALDVSKNNNDVLPIFLPLVLVKKHSQDAMVDCCLKQLKDQGYSFGKGKKAKELFVSKAKLGAFQLYLDGLDEVGSGAASLLNVINEISVNIPNMRIYLSCRSTFDIPPLKNSFHLMLNSFNDKQLKKFIKKWFSSQPTTYKGLINWLRLNKEIKKAALNPLIAALLCSLYQLGADMPSTETELYEKRIDLLLGKWDNAKGIRYLDTKVIKNYWRFISDLALEMHTKEWRTISISDTSDIAEKHFNKCYGDELNDMIMDCVHRGILEFENSGELSFGHHTYQEYLVARKLFYDSDMEYILRKIGDPWWTNVFKFYAAKKEDISSLIKLAINKGCTEKEYNVLRELVQIAKYTDKYIIQRLAQKVDYYIETIEQFTYLVS